MAMVIQNNMAAMMTLGELNKNNSALGKQLKKIASGERITSAGDDSSGYAISEKMRVRIRALGQADRNTQTGISLIRTAEGAIQSQIDILKTIKDKVLDAQNDTNTDVDRATIQKEIDHGYQQMEDIAWETNYNGILLLCGGDVAEHKHTNWAEEAKPEFGIYDNDTMNIKPLITATVKGAKSEHVSADSRTFFSLNQQPINPDSEILGSVDSVYDLATPYLSQPAAIVEKIGQVDNTLNMQHGVNWQAATNTVTISYNDGDSVNDVLSRLKNLSFTVTLNGEKKEFIFVDDLAYTNNYTYTYSYKYTDTNGDEQTKTGSSTVYVTSKPTEVTYAPTAGVSGTSYIKLSTLSNAGSAVVAANLALGKLADEIALASGLPYDIDGSTGNASQRPIYGDSIKTSDGHSTLTLASGEYDFEITGGTHHPSSYTDSTLTVAKVTNAANGVVNTAVNTDYAGISDKTGNPYDIQVTGATVTAPTSKDGDESKAVAAAGDEHIAEESAYVDIKLDDLIDGTTDIEEMINKFLFKARDKELNTADADPSDANIFDTGNNLVVDKSFTVTNYKGEKLIYEFIDTNRPDLDINGDPVGTTAGKKYLYDEQKIPGSIVCDLDDFRAEYKRNGGNLKAALAQFLFDSLDYKSYARNRTYTRELLTGDADPTVTTNAAAAETIRLYSYQPYKGTENPGGSISDDPPYMAANIHRHYATERYSGQGAKGSDGAYDQLVTDETYLCSYDLDLKAWWAANIGDPGIAGDESTAATLGNRLNQRGFRFYCPADSNEWINIYFTDHSIEDDLELERPQAGNTPPLTTGDKIDTIVVDVRGIKNYKELTRAIYEQTNLLSWASEPSPEGATPGAASDNTDQAGFTGNPLLVSRAHTDYFSHFHFAMDEDKGILTIFDTDRYAHGREMYVSDGVYDNVRLEVREVKEKRLIIHDTDHASQAVAIHIPRTTLDYVFGFNPAKSSASDYTVLRKEMREQMLGMSKEAVGILDRGLNYLTSANCLLGAQINRLEFSHANLTTSVENTTNSESTMRDADMAKEMAEYTKANVLLQASQSMLAQANQNSSQVIGLLQ